MWVYIYEGVTGQAEGYYTGSYDVNVSDGQYFFQDESVASKFYTYDTYRGTWESVSGSYINGTQRVISLEDGRGVRTNAYLYRMDVFNCSVWGYCELNGSEYTARYDFHVYDEYGYYKDTIYAGQMVIVDYGYGFTKADTIGEDGVDRMRIWGKKNGTYLGYGFNAYAAIDYTQHPSSYDINTY